MGNKTKNFFVAIVVIFFVAIVVIAFVATFPSWLVDHDLKQGYEIKNKLGQVNEYRKITIQVIAGLGALFGLYLTSRRIKAMEENVRISEKGQITDRFSKAVEHLEGDFEATQLGGVFALDQIARDSKEFHQLIMKMLSSVVRSFSTKKMEKWKENRQYEQYEPEYLNKTIIPSRIQAIITLIGTRETKHDAKESIINLVQVYLPFTKMMEADLRGVDLSGAYLEGANLEGANLEGVELRTTILINSNLKHAKLAGATLMKANLKKAKLQWADFSNAEMGNINLSEANLKYANLKKANLLYANFENAILAGADLRGADLSDTNLNLNQLLSAKHDETTSIDHDLKKELEAHKRSTS